MKLYSWNVNGLRACMTKGFAEFLQEAAPDIICLQETKMQREQADFVFPGYEEYWNSAERKGYSGTAVFTRVKPLAVTYGLGQEEHDKEGRVITLEFESFYLVTVYDYRMVWEDVFRAYLQELDAKKPVVVCGDLNVAAEEIDLKNPKTNRKNAGFTDEERAKFRELKAAGFTDSFRYLHPEEVKYSWLSTAGGAIALRRVRRMRVGVLIILWFRTGLRISCRARRFTMRFSAATIVR